MRRLIVKPAALAEARSVLRRSRAEFGSVAARRYESLIRRAYRLLCANPKRPGVQQRDGLPDGVCLFHLRHARAWAGAKQPRHFIVFTFDDAALTAPRVLHDSMDVEQHMGEQTGEA